MISIFPSVTVPIKAKLLNEHPELVFDKMEDIKLRGSKVETHDGNIKVCILSLEAHRVPLTCSIYPMYTRLNEQPVFLELRDNEFLLFRYKLEWDMVYRTVDLSLVHLHEAVSIHTAAHYTMRLLVAICQI